MNRTVSLLLVPSLFAAVLTAGVVHAQTTPATPVAEATPATAAAAPAPATDAATTEATAAAEAPEAVEATDAAEAAEATPAAEAAAAPAAAPAAAANGAPAWMPPMQPGKALVIIFRESKFVGGGVAMKVLADEGTMLPKLKNGRVIKAYFEPGDHTFYSDKKKQRDARIVGVEADQVYFFEARFETNMMRKADVDLVPVDYAEGVRRVSAFKHPWPMGS